MNYSRVFVLIFILLLSIAPLSAQENHSVTANNLYRVENQWGGSDSPWNPGGMWVLGGRTDQPVVSLNIVSTDNGITYTGEMTYEGEGPITFRASQVYTNTYSVEVQWGGSDAPWNPGGMWVIGARDGQPIVSASLSRDSEGQLVGEITYEGEGPISFRSVSVDNLLQNGSFEEGAPDGNRVIPNDEQGTSAMDIVGWEVTSGSVDWLGVASNVAAADGVQFVDVSSFTAGTISQTFDTTQCATYGVNFALTGATAEEPAQKGLIVSAGNTVQNFTYEGESNVWEDRSLSFTATSNTTTLTFTSPIDGIYGPQIDNVRVLPVISDIGFTKDELADTTWEFARADGSVIGSTFVLNADGTIGGYNNPNEALWDVVSGTLVIYSVDNIPSTCFTSATTEDAMVTLQGAFLLDPSLNITHILRRAGQ